MRLVFAVSVLVFFAGGASSSRAQHIHRSEPLVLAPYGVALVQDNSCATGKILKVTGAIRGLRRKKECVVLGVNHAKSDFQ